MYQRCSQTIPPPGPLPPPTKMRAGFFAERSTQIEAGYTVLPWYSFLVRFYLLELSIPRPSSPPPPTVTFRKRNPGRVLTRSHVYILVF